MTPGDHLRLELKRLALNQKELAATLDISRQTINNIINDRQQVSRPLARKLGPITGKASDYWLRDSYPDPLITTIVSKPMPKKRPKTIRQLKPIKFHTFVTNHAHREFDAQLIERMRSDQNFRTIESWASFRSLLVRNGASDGDFVSARAAWKKYVTQVLKPASKSSSG